LELVNDNESELVNWNASKFWIDGGCLGNEAHGKREAYGSISDGETVERFQFSDARTNNESEYKTLCALLGKLLRNRVDPQDPETNIYTDSQLVFGQLIQGWKVEAKNLLALHHEAALALRKTGAKIIRVPRSQIVEKLGH
jgi:ribonuclease HI